MTNSQDPVWKAAESLINIYFVSFFFQIKKTVKIHEDSLGQIYTVGLTFSPVTSAAEVSEWLIK